MSQHILYICPYVEKDISGGGEGGEGIYFWKGLFTGSPKISLAKP